MDDKITYNNNLTKELVNYLHYQIENNPNVMPYTNSAKNIVLSQMVTFVRKKAPT